MFQNRYLAPCEFNQYRRRLFFYGPAFLLNLRCSNNVFSNEINWPYRPLRIIVGYTPGSSPDIQARLLAGPLSEQLEVVVTIENKPGASGNIGAGAIANATDKHTIGMIGNGPLTSSSLLYKKLPYTAPEDFSPISLISAAPLLWVVSGKQSFPPIFDLLVERTRNVKSLAYGSVGIGSGGHLAMEFIKKQLSINILHVPYSGSPAIINAILGEQIDMSILPLPTVLPLIKSGDLQALAVCGPKRSLLLPAIPSLQELMPDSELVDFTVWNGMVAPASLDQTLTEQLGNVVSRLLSDAKLQGELKQAGWVIPETGPNEFSRRISVDTQIYKRLINELGITIG